MTSLECAPAALPLFVRQPSDEDLVASFILVAAACDAFPDRQVCQRGPPTEPVMETPRAANQRRKRTWRRCADPSAFFEFSLPPTTPAVPQTPPPREDIDMYRVEVEAGDPFRHRVKDRLKKWRRRKVGKPGSFIISAVPRWVWRTVGCTVDTTSEEATYVTPAQPKPDAFTTMTGEARKMDETLGPFYADSPFGPGHLAATAKRRLEDLRAALEVLSEEEGDADDDDRKEARRRARRRRRLLREVDRLERHAEKLSQSNERCSAACGHTDIDTYRRAFWNKYQRQLKRIPGAQFQVFPVDSNVSARHLSAMRASAEPRFAFHGSPLGNHESIQRHGLVVPGTKGVGVANGEAYGRGVYVGIGHQISLGYSRGAPLFVVSVIPGPAVTNHSALSVVTDERFVCPLFRMQLQKTNLYSWNHFNWTMGSDLDMVRLKRILVRKWRRKRRTAARNMKCDQ